MLLENVPHQPTRPSGFHAKTAPMSRGGSSKSKKPNNLAQLRNARGMTQAQLAEAFGSDTSTISKLETGKLQLKIDQIKRFAEILHCSPGDVVEAGESDAAQAEAISIFDSLPEDKRAMALQFLRSLSPARPAALDIERVVASAIDRAIKRSGRGAIPAHERHRLLADALQFVDEEIRAGRTRVDAD